MKFFAAVLLALTICSISVADAPKGTHHHHHHQRNVFRQRVFINPGFLPSLGLYSGAGVGYGMQLAPGLQFAPGVVDPCAGGVPLQVPVFNQGYIPQASFSFGHSFRRY